MKQDCPYEICFVLQDDGDKKGKELVLKRIKEEHNHDVLKVMVDCHAKKRRLDDDSKNMASQALKLKSNRKLLQQHLQQSTGKRVTLKDLSNLEQRLKAKAPDKIKDLIKHLESSGRNLQIKVAYQDTEVEGIFVTDGEMAKMYRAYPEVLLMDAIYKLTNDRMAVYLLLAIDGNGESHVVCFFLVNNETRNLITKMVEAFKEKFDEEVTSKTKVIITDKDFTERSVLTAAFPGAQLQLCLFHTMQSFGREVTAIKMSFRPEQRNTVLSLLHRLVYSKNQEEYDRHLAALEQANFPMVMDYVKRSWHSIRWEWVVGLKAESLMLSQHTTNRLESLNKHIKSVISKFSNLPVFFDHFFIFLDSYRDERDYRALRMLDIAISCENPSERQYRSHLTTYAWEQMEGQFRQAMHLQVTCSDGRFQVDGRNDVSITSCGCHFMSSNGLPCRHVLAARRHSGAKLFEADLALPRWTRAYFVEQHPLFQRSTVATRQADTSHHQSSLHVDVQPVQRETSQDYSRKISYARAHCAKLATALAMLPDDLWYDQIEQVKMMDKLVNQHKLCKVIEVDPENRPAPGTSGIAGN